MTRRVTKGRWRAIDRFRNTAWGEPPSDDLWSSLCHRFAGERGRHLNLHARRAEASPRLCRSSSSHAPSGRAWNRSTRPMGTYRLTRSTGHEPHSMCSWPFRARHRDGQMMDLKKREGLERRKERLILAAEDMD
jgi:hypothetical protein